MGGDRMKFGEKNVGKTDKMIRIAAGLVLMASILIDIVQAPLSYLAFVIGLAMFGTALFGTCTLYSLLGISTVEKK